MSEDKNELPQVHREPLTPTQIRGIDLIFKGIRKIFPYVAGWRKSDSFDKYESQMFIDLIIDMNKLSKYHNRPIKHYWVEELETGRLDYGNGLFFLEDYESLDDKTSQNRRFIESRINETYKMLPKEFQVWVTWSGPKYMTNPDGTNYQSVSTIDISNYFCKIF